MYRLRRSVLFVPGNNQKMVEKASRLRPDVVLIDCEDSVPEGEKEKARESLRSALTTHTWSSREVGVRVNAPDTPYFDEDLRVAVASGFELIAVPKVEGPEEVRLVERTLNELTRGKQLPSPKLLVMIETAKGVTFVDQILASSSLITAVEFGAEDFALSMGIFDIDRPETTLLYAKSRIAAAAHAFGIDPIDQVFLDLRNTEGLRLSALSAKNLGFVGKLVIHPDQIDVVNRAFSPSEREINWARRIVEAWEEHGKEGRGAFRLDDRMIDLVHVRMAERILDAERSARTS